MEQLQTYVCRRLRMKMYLDSLGFRYYKKVKDLRNEKFWIFLYDDSPTLRAAIENYYKQSQNR